MTIRPGQTTYSVAAHDEVLQAWEARPDTPAPLHLDLSGVHFVDPYGMAVLVLFINHLPESALPVRLELPGWPGEGRPPLPHEHTPPVSYLTRMGFWDAVHARLAMPRHHLPAKPARMQDHNVLLEVSVLRDHPEVQTALRQTGDILGRLGYSPPARGYVMEVLSELCSNVLIHAGTEFGAVAAMQTYRNKQGHQYVVMGIGDAGIGVRASLAKNPAMGERVESDTRALGAAVQPGTSRFTVGGHGGGLPRVLEIARRYRGRFAARSGTGALVYYGEDNKWRTMDAIFLSGTCLRFSLPEAGLRARPGDAPAMASPEE